MSERDEKLLVEQILAQVSQTLRTSNLPPDKQKRVLLGVGTRLLIQERQGLLVALGDNEKALDIIRQLEKIAGG